jgi:hypothetical protein
VSKVCTQSAYDDCSGRTPRQRLGEINQARNPGRVQGIIRETAAGVLDVPIDQRFDLMLYPGRQDRILESLHVPRRHRSRAGLPQRLSCRATETIGSETEQHSGLPPSKIIANRLPRGDGVSPNAENLIPQCECDAGMTSEAL